MKKTTKFFVAAICVAVAAVCVLIGIDATRQSEDEQTTVTAAPVTVTPTTSEPATEETTTENIEKDLAGNLIGKWTDSAELSGFEFFEDGKASVTLANIDVLGLKFDGTIDNGTYKLEGNTLSLTYSIYTATIEKIYEISIENDVLKMTDIEDGKVSSYVRKIKNDKPQQTVTNSSFSDELYGSWENKSMSKIYKFANNGSVTVTLDGESFSGVYLTEDNEVTIQYTAYGKKITEKYTYAVTTNALTLTNPAGTEFIFLRAGTSDTSDDDNEILGTWRDSADVRGYEFKENGVLSITYFDVKIPVIDALYSGSLTGSYEINDDSLTISYFILGKSVTENYSYEINGNTLKMVSADGETLTYFKQ